MFINFWYAAELSENLAAKPIKVRMLGHNFVLFRDRQGTAHCLSNICVHRCGSLADGWMSGDQISCPYHGWEFGGDGACSRIPSVGPDLGTKPPTRARVDSYPTQERYGIVFVFLGDLPETERPPLMQVPEWDDSRWRVITEEYTWAVNYRRAVENALDFAHAEFVHLVGRKGRELGYRVPDYQISEADWGAGARVNFKRQAKGLWKYVRDAVSETTAGTDFHGPAQFMTFIQMDPKMVVLQYVYETPIDEYNTRTFLVSARNFFITPLLDRIVKRQNRTIINEDRKIVEALDPSLPPESTTSDLSVKTDLIQMAYRQKLQTWEARGWRIDTDRLFAEKPGKNIYTIPSPARRHSANWVFPTVPLKAAMVQNV